MKTRNLIQIGLLCAVMLPATLQAQLTFVTNNNAISITGFTGPAGNVIIPNATNGFPVVSIGQGAFQFNTSLTSVTIGSNVTTIGDYAFCVCIHLANVVIGTNVTRIGSYAFDGCLCLTSVTIPNSVTSIGYNGFAYCTSLTNVTIGNSVTDIGEDAFGQCSLTTVTIPNSVTNIGEYAFQDCYSVATAYFEGNAPSGDNTIFSGESGTAYYLPGAAGWGSMFGGWPTGFWPAATVWGQPPTDLVSPSLGRRTVRWWWKPARSLPMTTGVRWPPTP